MNITRHIVTLALILSSATSNAALVQISPTTPDPILDAPTFANLEALMTEDFNSPFYPAWPDLTNVQGQFNNYFASDTLSLNPTDDRFMITNMFTDIFRAPPVYQRFYAPFVNALSSDGGKTWTHLTIPTLQVPIGLGGSISQQLGFRGYPFSYSRCGVLHSVWNYSDMHTNPPNTVPASGIYVSRSFDNGHTWSAPIFLIKGISGAFIDGTAETFTGAAYSTCGILADPGNANLVHVSFNSVIYPTTLFGNVFYARSEDAGAKWSKPIQIYDMAKDPVWVAQHADHNFSPIGGQCWQVSPPLAVGNDVLLISFLRFYPRRGSPTYDGNLATNTVTDTAFVRSLDNGKTWSPSAAATEQFFIGFSNDPLGSPNAPFPDDGAIYRRLAVSPKTGRVYLALQAANQNVSTDPVVFLQFPYIALSVSSDQGATWSPYVQINRTPTDTNIIPFINQQAFNPNIICTQDGHLVVVYNDYRNFNAADGFAKCDAWMDIYRETTDPKGGNTNVGLQFVKEISLTPGSFNSSVGRYNGSILRGIGSVIGLALTKTNEVLYTINLPNQSNLPTFRDGFNNMLIDPNNRFNVFLGRVKFPRGDNR